MPKIAILEKWSSSTEFFALHIVVFFFCCYHFRPFRKNWDWVALTADVDFHYATITFIDLMQSTLYLTQWRSERVRQAERSDSFHFLIHAIQGLMGKISGITSRLGFPGSVRQPLNSAAGCHEADSTRLKQLDWHQHTDLLHSGQTRTGLEWPHLVSPLLPSCCCWLRSPWLKVREVWKCGNTSVCEGDAVIVTVIFAELTNGWIWPVGRTLHKIKETHTDLGIPYVVVFQDE